MGARLLNYDAVKQTQDKNYFCVCTVQSLRKLNQSNGQDNDEDQKIQTPVRTPQCLSCTEGPDLDTALEVWPHQCPAQGDNPCPAPAGHTIADPGQDAIALLGPWAHPGSRSAAGTSTPRSFPATLSQPVALTGIVVTQGQDPALGLVEPHTIGLSPWIQPGQIPLQSLPALQQTNTPAKRIGPNWGARLLNGHQLEVTPLTITLGLAIQPVFNPVKGAPV
ncbi:hypothetical protein DUI87_27007 [Hirundo rustica rustica]|uniref:Uncharacterized protein n=1 Tax=Hirundo rustica rustica TaxID=333673 RepID=A0A3M0JCI2_HIRRU|nr:hypothetical protein DUI87_27007 [Hirundo rustica rustica]